MTRREELEAHGGYYLTTLCERAGLDRSGSKEELIDRLLAAEGEGAESAPADAAATETTEPAEGAPAADAGAPAEPAEEGQPTETTEVAEEPETAEATEASEEVESPPGASHTEPDPTVCPKCGGAKSPGANVCRNCYDAGRSETE